MLIMIVARCGPSGVDILWIKDYKNDISELYHFEYQ